MKHSKTYWDIVYSLIVNYTNEKYPAKGPGLTFPDWEKIVQIQ